VFFKKKDKRYLMKNQKLREELAAYAHNAWSGWMKYMFGKSVENEDGSVTIPADLVRRWKRQSETRYVDLLEKEKKSDLEEADKMIYIFINWGGLS